MNKRLAKAINVVSAVIMFAAFAFGVSFYHRDLPHTPVPEAGRIYPLNNHGQILYMTHREKVQQQVSFTIFGVLAVIAVVSELFLGTDQREKSETANDWKLRWRP